MRRLAAVLVRRDGVWSWLWVSPEILIRDQAAC